MVAQRGLVDALIEPHALAVVVVVFAALAATTSVLMLRTSTATYLPMSDQATTASTAVSFAMMTRIGCSRMPSASGASSTRSLWPSFRLLSLPRAPSAAVIALMSSGVGAELAQDRRDDVALLERDGALVPGIAAGGLRVVFGSRVTFSGTMRGSKPA